MKLNYVSSLLSPQTAQTVMLVVATFLLSWLPQHIITMWAQFGNFPMTDASFAFRIISHCMVYGNSCINPIIYGFLSENFRKACHQAFVCKFPSPHPIEEKVVRIRMENFSAASTSTNAWKHCLQMRPPDERTACEYAHPSRMQTTMIADVCIIQTPNAGIIN